MGRRPTADGPVRRPTGDLWVENIGSQETVKGAILERDSGRAILNIDLSEQWMNQPSLPKARHPTLSSTANGDLLVAWLEPDDTVASTFKAALYELPARMPGRCRTRCRATAFRFRTERLLGRAQWRY